MFSRFIRKRSGAADGPASDAPPIDPTTIPDDTVRQWCRGLFDHEAADAQRRSLTDVHAVMTYRASQSMPSPLDVDAVESVLSVLYLQRDHGAVVRVAVDILVNAVASQRAFADVVVDALQRDPDMVLLGLAAHHGSPDTGHGNTGTAADSFWSKHGTLDLLERLVRHSPGPTLGALSRTRYIGAISTALLDETDDALGHRALQTLRCITGAFACDNIGASPQTDGAAASPSRRRMVRGELAMRLAFEGAIDALLTFSHRRGGFQYPHRARLDHESTEETSKEDDVATAAEVLNALIAGQPAVIKYVVEMRLVEKLAVLLPAVGSPGVLPGSMARALLDRGATDVASEKSKRWETTIRIGCWLMCDVLAVAARGAADGPRTSGVSAAQQAFVAALGGSSLLAAIAFTFSEVSAAAAVTPVQFLAPASWDVHTDTRSLVLGAATVAAVVAHVLPAMGAFPTSVISLFTAGSCDFVKALATVGVEWHRSSELALLSTILHSSVYALADRSESKGGAAKVTVVDEALLHDAITLLAEAISVITAVSDPSTGSGCSVAYAVLRALVALRVRCAGDPSAAAAAALSLSRGSVFAALRAGVDHLRSSSHCCHDLVSHRHVVELVLHFATTVEMALATRDDALTSTVASQCAELSHRATAAPSCADGAAPAENAAMSLECDARPAFLGTLSACLYSFAVILRAPQVDASTEEACSRSVDRLTQWKGVAVAARSSVAGTAEARRWDPALRIIAGSSSSRCENSPNLFAGDAASHRASRDDNVGNPWCPLAKWHSEHRHGADHGHHSDQEVPSIVTLRDCGSLPWLQGHAELRHAIVAYLAGAMVVEEHDARVLVGAPDEWFGAAHHKLQSAIRDYRSVHRDSCLADELAQCKAQLAAALGRVAALETELGQEREAHRDDVASLSDVIAAAQRDMERHRKREQRAKAFFADFDVARASIAESTARQDVLL